MENESTSTWTFLKKSGESEDVESDPSSDSSIEFIYDDIVHYDRNNHQLSFEPEVQKNSQDVAENPSALFGFDSATATDNVSTLEGAKGDETNRSELTLENISSVNSNASVSPSSTSPVSPSSSDDSSGSVTLLEGRLSDEDLDTFPEDFWFDSDFELLDQHTNSDLAHLQLAASVKNALPSTNRSKINFKFKKQVLRSTNNEMETLNACDADDEDSNNVELCSSAEESEVAPVEEIPPVTNIGSLSPVMAHLPISASIFKPPRMSITFLMLASLVMGLLLGLVTKYSLDPYSREQLSADINEIHRINEMHLLKEENEHMRKYVESLKGRINNLQNSNKQELSDELRQVNQLLKGRIDELDQQILVVRQAIIGVKSGVQPPKVSDKRKQDHQEDIIQNLNEPASDNNPEPQTEINGSDPDRQTKLLHSDSKTQTELPHPDPQNELPHPDPQNELPHPDPKTEQLHPDPKTEYLHPDLESATKLLHPHPESEMKSLHPDIESETELLHPDPEFQTEQLNSDPNPKPAEIHHSISDPSHDLIKIHNSPEEQVPEESKSLIFNPDTTDHMLSVSGGSIVDVYQNDAFVVSDEVMKSEKKADETIAVLRMKLEKEKRRADNLKKLYMKLKNLNSGLSGLLTGSTVEMVQEKKDKATKASASYCLPLDKDCSASMDWLNRDAMLQLITSVISDIPPQAQQWKQYISQKLQNLLDPQEFDEELKVEHESNLNSKSKKLKSYMNRILNQLNKAKVNLHANFEKTLHKIKKGTRKFWDKNVLNNDKQRKFKESKEKKKDQKFANIKKSEVQDSSSQLNKYADIVDETKEETINPETEEFRQHQNELEIVEKNENIKNSSKKMKSSIKEKRHREERKNRNRGDESKKQRPYKSNNKGKKHQHELTDKRHGPQKSDKDGKKYRPHKSDNEHNDKSNDDKKHWPHNEYKKNQYRSNDMEHGTYKLDTKDKKHLYDEDGEDKSQKSKNTKKNRSKESNDDENQTKKESVKKMRRSSDRSDDTKKHLRKHKYLNKKIIDKNLFNGKSPSKKRNQRKMKEYKDGKKSVKKDPKKNLQKRNHKKSKTNPKIKVQSTKSCDQFSINLKDSVNTISKERFEHMNVQTILRMSKKLSNFNKQCKQFSTKSMKEWSACQQMWWTLCGQGLLSGQLRKTKCQRYLLTWQISAAVSPDGGGKPGCDDCGCQKRAVKDYLDPSNEDRQNTTDSDSAFPRLKEGTKVLSGEWYFKHKSVPTENLDCDEDRLGYLLSLSTDMWDELSDIISWFECRS